MESSFKGQQHALVILSSSEQQASALPVASSIPSDQHCTRPCPARGHQPSPAGTLGDLLAYTGGCTNRHSLLPGCGTTALFDAESFTLAERQQQAW